MAVSRYSSSISGLGAESRRVWIASFQGMVLERPRLSVQFKANSFRSVTGRVGVVNVFERTVMFGNDLSATWSEADWSGRLRRAESERELPSTTSSRPLWAFSVWAG